MDVVLVHAGAVAVALELNLELHLLPRYRLAADHTCSTDAWAAPRAIRSAARKFATLNGLARLHSENLFVWHLAVPRRAADEGATRCEPNVKPDTNGEGARYARPASPEGRQVQDSTVRPDERAVMAKTPLSGAVRGAWEFFGGSRYDAILNSGLTPGADFCRSWSLEARARMIAAPGAEFPADRAVGTTACEAAPIAAGATGRMSCTMSTTETWPPSSQTFGAPRHSRGASLESSGREVPKWPKPPGRPDARAEQRAD